MSDLVRYHAAGSLATITLDSPANRNALSAPLLRELQGHLASSAADATVRVVVLTHTGDVFCSGVDLGSVAGVSAEEQPVHAFPALLQAVLDSPKPVVARIDGKARAGGVGLLAACDVTLGSTRSNFAVNEVRLGLVAAVVSLPLQRRLSPRALRELYLTGEVFDGIRAAAVGLLDAAVPAEDLAAEVRRYSDMLAAGAPGALATVKRLLADPPAGTVAERLAALAEISAHAFAGAEGQEGTAAWRERRPARWVPAG
jgi:methylglutaconyl-CoA hydratase